MVVIGLLMVVVAPILYFVRRYQRSKMFSLKSAPKVTAAELRNTAQGVAEEIGSGDWRDYVKVWGRVETDFPLTSEHSKKECVYYSSQVIREYETQETETDSEGKTQVRTVRRSDTISDNKQSVPFRVVDATGTVEINPEGADIETVEVMNEFRPGNSGMNVSFSVGKFKVSGGTGNTLGYRYRESILPLNRNVLVVGAASDLTGEVVISKPTKDKRNYIISLKDEESLAKNLTDNIKYLSWGFNTCAALGPILTVIGLLAGI